MKKLEKYDGSKVYMYPDGTMATVESVTNQFPAWEHFTHIVETDDAGEIMWAFQNLSAMCSIRGIDAALSEAEKIVALEEILNAPAPEPEVSADERIAAALEYQNMLTL